MIFDYEAMFSDDQDITTTANSENIVDLGEGGGAKATPILIGVQVTEDFNNLTSLTVSLTTDDNTGFSSATTLFTSGAILLADLVAGKQINLPPLNNDSERYLRLTYTVAGSAATTGQITAGLVADMQTND